jgi:hypothetical protein
MSLEFKWVYGDEARMIDTEPIPWPPESHVLFVYEDGNLIGRSSIVFTPMIEGTRLDPEKRNGTLAARIIHEVERRYLEFAKPVAMAFAPNDQPEIGEYLERFGFEPRTLTMYTKNLIAKEEPKAA